MDWQCQALCFCALPREQQERLVAELAARPARRAEERLLLERAVNCPRGQERLETRVVALRGGLSAPISTRTRH